MKKTFKRQSKTLNSKSKKRTMKAMKGGAGKLAPPVMKPGPPVMKHDGGPMKPVSGLVPQSFSKENKKELSQLTKIQTRKEKTQAEYERLSSKYFQNRLQLQAEKLPPSIFTQAKKAALINMSTHYKKKANSKIEPLRKIATRIEELKKKSAAAAKKAEANEATVRKVLAMMKPRK